MIIRLYLLTLAINFYQYIQGLSKVVRQSGTIRGRETAPFTTFNSLCNKSLCSRVSRLIGPNNDSTVPIHRIQIQGGRLSPPLPHCIIVCK